MDKIFDLIVIGAGPGGYVASIRSAQLGLSVLCIDAWQNSEANPALGGTCTNVGCIPSKALLQSSEYYEFIKHGASCHGIECSSTNFNIDTFLKRKDDVIKKSNEGIAYLFKKNKINFLHGIASFIKYDLNEVWHINIKHPNHSNSTVLARRIIIATGSAPRAIHGIDFDEQKILSNKGALSLKCIPKKLGIIGAGVIGLEIGSIWSRLGSDVSILESSQKFLPNCDTQISREYLSQIRKNGIKILMGATVKVIEKKSDTVEVTYTLQGNGESKLDVNALLISIGRIPFTNGLNAEAVGLNIDNNGYIVVDEACKTNLPNVWAIGDTVRGPMLAHKAEEEGIFVAERICGQSPSFDLNMIPFVIYTEPEVAWVGKTEQELEEQNCSYKSGTAPFRSNGRARASGNDIGFVKILADTDSDRILGVHILGKNASELISEAVTVMNFHGAAEDIARICHAHPTLSEVLKEAALAVENRAISH